MDQDTQCWIVACYWKTKLGREFVSPDRWYFTQEDAQRRADKMNRRKFLILKRVTDERVFKVISVKINFTH